MSTTDSMRYGKRFCAVCDSPRDRLLFRQTFTRMSSGSLLDGYDVVACEDCGFGYADHIPTQAEFDAHYRDMSKYEYQDQGVRESEHDLIRFSGICDRIAPMLPDRGARILDVGCSTGRLLSLLKERGYSDLTGLDPSPLCSEIAGRLFGIRVGAGTIFDVGETVSENKPYDCVIITGVLEHIRDIGPATLCFRELLAPGGLIFIEVPDATDFASWPDAPFQEFSTEHINFFSDRSLENLMRRYRFERVESRRIAMEQSDSTVIPVVSAVYRKTEGCGTIVPAFDQETALGLEKYISKSCEVENRIHQTIEMLVEFARPVVVWGVGTHTLHLLASSRLPQANIRAFVDSNPRYQGKQLNGRPILSPAELHERRESILISSRVFETAIEKQIREELRLNNEIIKLYDVAAQA